MSTWIKSIYQASRALNIVKEFYDCRTRIELIKQDIWFNTQCRFYRLTPNYINIKQNNNSKAANLATKIGRITWLNMEIRDQYSKKQALTEKMYKLHLEIGKQDLDNKMDYAYWKHADFLSVKLHNKHQTLVNKLNRLKQVKQIPKRGIVKWGKSKAQVKTHKFHERVVNTSKMNFSQEEMEILEKGHKHNLVSSYNKKQVLLNTIAECETCVLNLPVEEREHAKHLITESIRECQAKEINKGRLDSRNSQVLSKLKNKIKDEHLIVTKADKGNSTVIMSKKDYVDKTLDFLNLNNMRPLNKDPTNKFQNRIKSALKDLRYTFKESEKFKLINMNPSAPTLKSLPKIHKENVPIRPIINCRSAPSYKLAKFLQQYLKMNYVFSNNRNILSSVSFAKRLHSLQLLHTHRMMSLDVKDMFSNVPVARTIEIIERNLYNNSNISTQETNEIVILLRLVTSQSYFIFNGTVYSQEEGLPMGSPLSGMLANIFLDDLETAFLDEFNKENSIFEWSRYVDDIFLIFDYAKVTAQQILEGVNEQHRNIKFTMEKEHNNKLNHLDLTLNRVGIKIHIDIFRKPTTTDHTIHENSNHPHTHKLAAYRFMVNRMLTLPLSRVSVNKETSTIKRIARQNGFNDDMIDRMIRRYKLKLKKARYNVQDKKQDLFYTSFTYVNEDTYKLTNMLKRKYGITPAYATRNTIKNFIHNSNIENFNEFDRSGVYKLTCQQSNCGAEYVGQTGRAFKVRYNEHVKGKIRNRPTAFSDHICDNNHGFTNIEQEMKVLHFVAKGRRLNTLEAAEIHLNKSVNINNLNEQTIFNSNILFSLLT